MNIHQKRSLQTFRRIQGWFIGHPELTANQQGSARPQLVAPAAAKAAPTTLATIPGISPDGVAQQVAAFNVVVERIATAAAEQEMHHRDAKDAANETARARWELTHRHISDIATIARTAIPDVVRTTAALKRPRGRDAEAVLAAADAMAKAAGQYRSELVLRGLPADFIEQLQAAAQAFRRAIDTRGAAVGRRIEAATVLDTAVSRGHVLAAAISVLVERRFAGNADQLAEWRQVKRVVLFGTRVQAVDAASQPSNAPVQAAQPSVPAVQGRAA